MSKSILFQPLRLGMIIAFILLLFGIHSTGATSPVSARSASRSFEPQYAGTETDLTTGSAAVFVPGLSLEQETAAMAGGNVLWDLTHGVYLAYEPAGNYADLVAQLNGEGFIVDTTTAGVDNVPLFNYDVLVVSVVTAWNSAYTASEVTAIENFVNNGGGLVVMCDNVSLGPPNGNINPVAQAFGTTCGISDLGDPLTDFASHPILSGISELDPVVGGEITASPPTALYAWDPGGKGAISATAAGSGVVMMGDVNFWDNTSLSNSDNSLFASNVFNWLSEPPEIEVDPTSFTFGVPLGATDSDIMDIVNLGGGILDWNISVHIGGTGVVGDWTLYYDWGCNGSPSIALLTLNPDFTFNDNFGGSGTWSQTDNEVNWNYIVGGDAVYNGYIAGAVMAGTMSATGGDGCWEANHIPSSLATVRASERTPSGEMVEIAEELVTLPTAAAVERVDVTSFSSRSFEPEYAGTETDLTTGSAAVFVPGLSLEQETAAMAGGNVLWDLTHGVYLAYEPAGNYADLVAQLNGEGFIVDTTTAGVDNVPLFNYDVLVVSVVTAWNSAYTASEVTAIENFVNNGGGLVVMCDNVSLGPPNGNINPVAQAFGTTCGISDLGDPLTDFASHPILSGISELDPVVGGEITASPPTALYAWDPGGKGAISATAAGSGVVMMGDVNFWDNINLSNSDNSLFASNVFNWLSDSWLSAIPRAGSTPRSVTDPVTVGVDTNKYTSGEYGLLVVHSNDGDEATIAVPVSLRWLYLPIILR